MARPNKYEEVILPNIKKIEEWLHDGVTYTDICKTLKISDRSFRTYSEKAKNGDPMYADLKEALEKSNDYTNAQIENALFKSACGYTWTEIVEEEITDPNGKITYKTRKRQVDVPPNFSAQQFWLTNRSPEKWKIRREAEKVDDGRASGVIIMPEVIDG